jgi:redox-sensitive bicupin YhaK (pirin superfamily)
MVSIRAASARGHADFGWLKTRYSFSFADYYDPAEMGWGALRVINDDIVAPGQGFPMHGHRDMEIVTLILDGALEHRDSLGNGSVIRSGEVQRMSAGTGVRHSEFNPSATQATHLLQIWIVPATTGIAPGYEQKRFEAAPGWQLLASADGADGSVRIHQDAALLRAQAPDAGALTHALAAGRLAYVHVISGSIAVNGVVLATGDGAKVSDETILSFNAVQPGVVSDFLLFDLPA